MQRLPRGVKQEQGEKMADVTQMRGDELRVRLEELVAELRIRSDPRTGATWEGDGIERGRGESPWAKKSKGSRWWS
ncbi:UNVERIFIED_CONTAM: hypothetical protein FKN15_072075 [Acipenser sinensis]